MRWVPIEGSSNGVLVPAFDSVEDMNVWWLERDRPLEPPFEWDQPDVWPAITKGLFAGTAVLFPLRLVTNPDAGALGALATCVVISLFFWWRHTVASNRHHDQRWEWAQGHWPRLSVERQQEIDYRRWTEENWDTFTDLEREEVQRFLFPQSRYQPNLTTTLIIADSIAEGRHHR
jgi:hypothetical protein